jgi:hypothetical protein
MVSSGDLWYVQRFVASFARLAGVVFRLRWGRISGIVEHQQALQSRGYRRFRRGNGVYLAVQLIRTDGTVLSHKLARVFLNASSDP